MSANLAQCRVLVQKAVTAGAKVQLSGEDDTALDTVYVQLAEGLAGTISPGSLRLHQLLCSRVALTCALGAGE